MADLSGLIETTEEAKDWHDEIASRIAYLRECAIDDEIPPNEAAMTEARAFLECLALHPERPAIFLHDNGDISIQWGAARDGDNLSKLDFKGGGVVECYDHNSALARIRKRALAAKP